MFCLELIFSKKKIQQLYKTKDALFYLYYRNIEKILSARIHLIQNLKNNQDIKDLVRNKNSLRVSSVAQAPV